MRIVMTGGAGFIGLAAAEAFLARGHQVTLVDLAPPPADWLAHSGLAGVRFIQANVAERAALEAAFTAPAAEAPYDVALHAAAITPDTAFSREKASLVAHVNFAATADVLEAAMAAGIRSVIVLSSVAIYGTKGTWDGETLTEQTALRPDTLYGITKAGAEALALHIGELHDYPVTSIRLGPVYGPWERAGTLRPNLSPQGQILALANAGEPPRLPSPMMGDWLYSRDAGLGLVLAAELAAKTRAGKIFNLGAGRKWSPLDWCAAMGISTATIGTTHANVVARAPDSRPPLDITALQTATGFTGTRDTEAAARDHRLWLDEISQTHGQDATASTDQTKLEKTGETK